MKKFKSLLFVGILTTALLAPYYVEARSNGGGTIVYENGCVETYENRSALFGLIKWKKQTSYICPDDGPVY